MTYHGAHLVVDDVAFLPTPVHAASGWSRVWPPGRRCGGPPGGTARLPSCHPPTAAGRTADGATVRQISAFLRDCRADAGLDGQPFDLVMSGMSPASPAAATDLAGSLAQAGATWWAECNWDDLESADAMLRRADQGPPRR